MTSTELALVDSPRPSSTSVESELTTSRLKSPPKEVPSGTDVGKAAAKLGIDPVFDTDLLYIAEDFLLTPLPRKFF